MDRRGSTREEPGSCTHVIGGTVLGSRAEVGGEGQKLNRRDTLESGPRVREVQMGDPKSGKRGGLHGHADESGDQEIILETLSRRVRRSRWPPSHPHLSKNVADFERQTHQVLAVILISLCLLAATLKVLGGGQRRCAMGAACIVHQHRPRNNHNDPRNVSCKILFVCVSARMRDLEKGLGWRWKGRGKFGSQRGAQRDDNI